MWLIGELSMALDLFSMPLFGKPLTAAQAQADCFGRPYQTLNLGDLAWCHEQEPPFQGVTIDAVAEEVTEP